MHFGRYEVLAVIGGGATSTVYQARDPVLGRTVALKRLRPHLAEGVWRDQFLEEARIVSSLNHPSILTLYDLGIDEETAAPFLVMEYMPGRTLGQFLVNEVCDPQQACRWGAGLARGLAHAHRHGIVHRDVKPQNILLGKDDAVKLADFGIAHWVASRLLSLGHHVGTPSHMAPEQLAGQPADTRSDVFSLGTVLYQLLTGASPFRGETIEETCKQILNADPPTPSQVNPVLDPALDVILARCLAKNPEERYSSADELATDLEARIVPATRDASSETAILTTTVLGALPGPRKDSPVDTTLVAGAPRQPKLAPAAMILLVALAATAGGMVGPQLWGLSPLTSVLPPAAAAQVGLSKPAAGTPGAAGTSPYPSPSLATEARAQKPKTVQLRVTIYASPAEETLALFVNERLLWSLPLSSVSKNESKLVRMTRLPAGAHHLRVALYKSDKTLGTELKALAELQPGERNNLTVRTSAAAFGRQRLQVAWPGTRE